jgi:carboxylesterase type B
MMPRAYMFGRGNMPGQHHLINVLTTPRIRYAAPPTGPRRWQAPQTPLLNRTITPATTFGPNCPQAYPAVPNAPFIPGNEDCLYLNVYAPPNSDLKKLPVLVWIHGGGYGFGDGTQDMSEIINANEKAFLAVSIQYRVSKTKLICICGEA